MVQTSMQHKQSKGFLEQMRGMKGVIGWMAETVDDILYKCSNLPETNYQLGCRMVADGRIDDAIMRFKMTLWLAPTHTGAMYSLGCLYKHQGKTQMALDSFTKVLRQDPRHENALFMVATINPSLLKPEMQPRTMPRRIVEEMFEGMAPDYDALQQSVSYQLPALMHQFLRSAMGDARYNDLLDLGCGTGMCGLNFREEFTNIVGVDLANTMLDMSYRRVDRRGVMIYNRLINEDLRAYLREADASSFDVAMCISVFPYVGALEDVFSGVARVLRTDGYFVCSFDPYPLRGTYGIVPASGYFCHHLDYVLGLAKANGFSVVRTGGVQAHPGHIVELCIFRLSSALTPDPLEENLESVSTASPFQASPIPAGASSPHGQTAAETANPSTCFGALSADASTTPPRPRFGSKAAEPATSSSHANDSDSFYSDDGSDHSSR